MRTAKQFQELAAVWHERAAAACAPEWIETCQQQVVRCLQEAINLQYPRAYTLYQSPAFYAWHCGNTYESCNL